MFWTWRSTDIQAAFRNTHSPFSKQSKNWLLSLAHIRFQIELAAHEWTEEIVSTRPSNAQETDNTEHNYWGLKDEYQSWSQDVKERASRNRPVNEDEAWSFVVDNRGLWTWRVTCRWLTSYSSATSLEISQFQRRASSPFVNLGHQLLETASTVNLEELSMLSEILDAIDLQLSVLGSFGELHHKEVLPNGRVVPYDSSWYRDLRSRIRDAVKQAESQTAGGRSKLTRSPAQHQQDNLLLQAMICVVLLGCIYPLYRALKSSSSAPGSTSEADFWLQIINSIIQLAGFLTLLLPIYRETAAKEWIGTWILTVLGIISSIVAVPLYLFAPLSWSAFFSWMASSVQLLAVLQVTLVAAFQNKEHAKRD